MLRESKKEQHWQQFNKETPNNRQKSDDIPRRAESESLSDELCANHRDS